MDIPHSLLRSIELGEAVLVLGAGASMGALSLSGKAAPTSLELARAIAKRFLGDQFSDRPLSSVASSQFPRAIYSQSKSSSGRSFKTWRQLPSTNYSQRLSGQG